VWAKENERKIKQNLKERKASQPLAAIAAAIAAHLEDSEDMEAQHMAGSWRTGISAGGISKPIFVTRTALSANGAGSLAS